MNKAKKISLNFTFIFLTYLLDVLVSLITAPYIAHVLLPTGNGAYSFSYSIVTFFYFFSIFGFAYYGQREIARTRDVIKEKSKAFYEIFIMKLLMSTFSFSILWILILTNIFGDYTQLIKILSLRLIATALDLTFFFQGEEKFGFIFSRNILVKVLSIICIFVFVKDSNDTWIYCLITTVSLLIGNLLMFFELRKDLIKIPIKEINPFTRFLPSLKLFLPVITSLVFSVLASFLIGLIVKDNDLSNGCYQSADKIIKLSLVAITSIGMAFLPTDSHEAKNQDYESIKKHLQISIRYCFFLGLPMTIGLVTLSNNITSWFFGNNYIYTANLMKILSSLIIIYSFRDIIGNQFLIPLQKDKFFSIIISIGLIINVIVSIILLYYIGVYGAAIGSVFAELIIAVSDGIYATKSHFINWKTLMLPIIKYACSAIIMFCAIFAVQKLLQYSWWSFIILLFLGITIYFLCLLIMKDKFIFDILKSFKIKQKKNKEKQNENINN